MLRLQNQRATGFCGVVVYGLNIPTTEDDQQVNRKNTVQSKERKVKFLSHLYLSFGFLQDASTLMIFDISNCNFGHNQ